MAGKDQNDPHPNTVPLREKLPDDLQKLVDKQDDSWDNVYEGAGPDTTESNVRYAAYANRLRTIMLSAHRYVAYTSDIGESFRPVAHPVLVRGAYAVSWAYILGDVGNEGWKAYKRNQRLLAPKAEEFHNATQKDSTEKDQSLAQTTPVEIPAIEDYRSVMVQRAVFQSIASMGLPAFTIHSIVKYSGKALKNAKNTTIRTWGPIGLGLAAVPSLPYLFDKPVEEAVEWTFYHAFRAVGGEKAVGDKHSTGREAAMQADARAVAKANKEL
ncbi:hypothetical protein A1O3_07246 [Capronia epimyces CBS 606.96]|uniref:Mitochondrial fission process protein 1 n=1 Tax=Capronia epimyces CBS 606.96 TaxID=1182542 RepID=W9XL95_9EURO|nr:uncharacterized protein A1O3_07246 [Capronia epimyces CBS 606.96]EXJ80958.1 hypothetical protein A1O3_07246 [Capronia epimyces CBS 606.96]